jgi:hypothetical protein
MPDSKNPKRVITFGAAKTFLGQDEDGASKKE